MPMPQSARSAQQQLEILRLVIGKVFPARDGCVSRRNNASLIEQRNGDECRLWLEIDRRLRRTVRLKRKY
jgi:hypothetical protein